MKRLLSNTVVVKYLIAREKDQETAEHNILGQCQSQTLKSQGTFLTVKTPDLGQNLISKYVESI